MDNEKWLPVVGYEGMYEVSDQGRVRSLDREIIFKYSLGIRRGAMKVTRPATGGYHVVGLGKDGKYSTLKVHRLIARAFLGEPPADKPNVNHIDFVRDNNRAENLEYCSQSENMLHSRDAGRLHLRTSATRRRSYNKEEIDLAISLMQSSGLTDREIASVCGFSKGYLSKLRAGSTWNTPDGNFPEVAGISPSRRRRLTPETAKLALQRAHVGEPIAEVAASLGVAHETVRQLVAGQTWKRLLTSPSPAARSSQNP